MKLALHHVTLPKEGETANGDAVVIRNCDGAVLVAVIDALGHGPAAAGTAAVAVTYLEALVPIPPMLALIEGLHLSLQGTRGAAAMVCTIDGARLVGCSVGNVEFRSRVDRIAAISSPGILGSRLRKVRIFEWDLRAGERIVLFSDGMSTRLSARDADRHSGIEACHALMKLHRRPHDDATVLLIDAIE